MEGVPDLTVEMGRSNPFDVNDGCGDGMVSVHADGLVDKVYSLWNRNPVTVSRKYMVSKGKQDRPVKPKLSSYCGNYDDNDANYDPYASDFAGAVLRVGKRRERRRSEALR